MSAGKIFAMRDISVQDSELLPVILEPLTSAALQAASGPSARDSSTVRSQAESPSPALPVGSAEAIAEAAPALEMLKVTQASSKLFLRIKGCSSDGTGAMVHRCIKPKQHALPPSM